MKITTRLLPVALVAVLFSLPPTANAQMNYQGRLTDGAGAARAPGPTKLTFSVHNAAGTKIWGDYVMDGIGGTGHGPKADVIADGRFNVIIGATDTASRTLTTAIAAAGTTSLFLEIKVENEAAISPRQQILATPRALFSDLAATIPNVTPTAAGNIGIGTTPDSKLHVSGSAAAPALKVDVNGSSKMVVNQNGGVAVGTGSAPPANGLLVSGSLATGNNITENGYHATSGEEDLRIIRGTASAESALYPISATTDYAPPVGQGFTFKHVSDGTIDVTFDVPFASTPTITGSNSKFFAGIAASINFQARGGAAGSTPDRFGFRMLIFNQDGGLRNIPADFIAIGPR